MQRGQEQIHHGTNGGGGKSSRTRRFIKAVPDREGNSGKHKDADLANNKEGWTGSKDPGRGSGAMEGAL